jgi:hypothetical protein
LLLRICLTESAWEGTLIQFGAHSETKLTPKIA